MVNISSQSAKWGTVHCLLTRGGESALTVLAAVWLDACVCVNVILQGGKSLEAALTH